MIDIPYDEIFGLLSETPTPNVIDEVKRFIELDAEVKAADKDLTELKERRDAVEAAVYTMLLGLNMKSMNVDGRNIFRKEQEYMSINKDNLVDAEAWLKNDAALEYLFKEKIDSRSMTTALKEYREEGGEIPKEYINSFTKKKLGNRKG